MPELSQEGTSRDASPSPGDKSETRSLNNWKEMDMVTNLVEPVVSPEHRAIPELSDRLEKDLTQIFKLLSDETRLRILMYLIRESELHVTALCERLEQSQPAVSHHLALLRVAGLIEARRDGKHNFYSVRRTYFHRIIAELFSSISDPHTDEVRFADFVLTQDS